MEKQPLVILTGPTAVGKTSLSIRLAKQIGAEIISADSMQVYKGMDIGTAKIKQEEMHGVKHYLIDVMNPDEEFNITIFKKMACEAIDKIKANGHIPLIVGGTGFYIQSVLYDIQFENEDKDTSYREELYDIARREGAEYLHDMLRKIDEKSADVIHYNNVKRVARAIEYYKQTGKKISEHNEEQQKKESPYNYVYFVLNDDRKLLYDRINLRVDQMFDEGLVDEVKRLKESGIDRDATSMQAIGYKEVLDYLDGLCTLEQLKENIKNNTRHFSKRQITWFKREKDIEWINLDEFGHDKEKLLSYMLQILMDKNIVAQ
jgi:tRNA dimethylallyltransferase